MKRKSAGGNKYPGKRGLSPLPSSHPHQKQRQPVTCCFLREGHSQLGDSGTKELDIEKAQRSMASSMVGCPGQLPFQGCSILSSPPSMMPWQLLSQQHLNCVPSCGPLLHLLLPFSKSRSSYWHPVPSDNNSRFYFPCRAGQCVDLGCTCKHSQPLKSMVTEFTASSNQLIIF